MRVDIYELLIQEEREKVCNCGWNKIRREELRRLLHQYLPTNMFAVPVSKFITQLNHVSTEETGTGDEQCSELHQTSERDETLYGRLEKIKNDNCTALAVSIILYRSTGSSGVWK